MKISIVMAYYNRKNLLYKTLESLDKSRVKDYELIIVDDASDEPLICDHAKVIRIEPKNKWYHNPCIPYNMGFKQAIGNVVVIQNPECYHMGDVLAYIENNLQPNMYFSFGCYAINKYETESFLNGITFNIENHEVKSSGVSGWYNHPIYRPVGYHFCSAIFKKELDAIGGFDERYAHGVAFDDDAFIRSVKRRGMDVQIICDPFVVHQFHTHFSYDDPKIWKPLHHKNHVLFCNT